MANELTVSKNMDLLWFAEIYNMAKRSNLVAFTSIDHDAYERIANLIIEDMKTTGGTDGQT